MNYHDDKLKINVMINHEYPGYKYTGVFQSSPKFSNKEALLWSMRILANICEQHGLLDDAIRTVNGDLHLYETKE